MVGGHLFDLLRAYQGAGVFNPYQDCDPALDRPNGAALRRQNLCRYLEAFAGAAYVLVGEAAGYAGCRFSGIPFTSEAQIAGAECLPWARGLGLVQSSREGPWRERSAGVVWGALGERRDCVLWNAFPWHPYADGPLSNRRPTRGELARGAEALACFLSLLAGAQVVAIGRVSEGLLAGLGISAPYIRHPAHGGRPAFVRGIASLREEQGSD